MTEPTATLNSLRTSTAALLGWLDETGWSDETLREPSLLPEWTRGHVLAHLARNADAIGRVVAGGLRGENVAMYVGGREGRAADIEDGAGRPFAQLRGEIQQSAERLDRVFAAAADAAAWTLPAGDRTIAAFVLARWMEVEIHRVDLGGDYGAADWSGPFVEAVLPELLDGLSARLGSDTVEVTISRASANVELSGRFGGADAADGVAPVEVNGPDWAVLAWLLGRIAAAEGALGAVPTLDSWL